MKRLLRVPSQNASNTFPTMPELLAPLRPHLEDLHWAIHELDFWVSREPTDQQAFLDQLAATERGLEVTFDELQRFADSTIQIIDGVFLGMAQSRVFPTRGADDATLIAEADVVLSAFDSSFWLVGGPEPLLQTLEQTFATEPVSGPLRA